MNEENYEYDEISLREIMEVIIRRKKIWISSTVIAILLSIVYLLFVYSPSYSINISLRNVTSIKNEKSYSAEIYKPFSNYEISTYLRSDSLLNEINKEFVDLNYELNNDNLTVEVSEDNQSFIEVNINTSSLDSVEFISDTYINKFTSLLDMHISERVEDQIERLLLSYENQIEHYNESIEFYEEQRDNYVIESDDFVMVQEIDGVTYEVDGVNPIAITLESKIINSYKAIDDIDFKMKDIKEDYGHIKDVDNYFELNNINVTDNSRSKVLYIAIFTVFGLFLGFVVSMFKEYWDNSTTK